LGAGSPVNPASTPYLSVNDTSAAAAGWLAVSVAAATIAIIEVMVFRIASSPAVVFQSAAPSAAILSEKGARWQSEPARGERTHLVGGGCFVPAPDGC